MRWALRTGTEFDIAGSETARRPPRPATRQAARGQAPTRRLRAPGHRPRRRAPRRRTGQGETVRSDSSSLAGVRARARARPSPPVRGRRRGSPDFSPAHAPLPSADRGRSCTSHSESAGARRAAGIAFGSCRPRRTPLRRSWGKQRTEAADVRHRRRLRAERRTKVTDRR